MQNRGAWIAFLLTCFALTGLVGLFASYSAAIPLERGLYRETALDAAIAGPGPERTAAAAEWGPGELAPRAATLRARIRADATLEAAAVGSRIRLMIVVVTLLSAAVGTFLLLLASRPPQPPPENPKRSA